MLARVGKRSLGQVALVEAGIAEVSDCVFIIRATKKYQKLILKSFLSDEGQAWIKAYSHGVCSRFISKRDLLEFPLKP